MTNTRRWVVNGLAGAACLWMLAGTVAGQASRAEMLLQQALTKELVEQDRASAVVLYEQVMSTPGVPAALAARARARVAALKPATPAQTTVARRVVYEDTEWNAVAVSPDGRFALGRASGTRPLMLRTLPAKDDRVLVSEAAGIGVLDPVFSPNGAMVAFEWVDGAAAGQRISIGVVGTAPNAVARRITPAVAGNVNQLTVVAWATDGAAVLVRTAEFERATSPVGQTTASTLDWVSVASGTTTKSMPFSPRNESPVMSPNGEYLAYERATSATGAAESRIYTVDSTGRNETEVVRMAGKNSSPRWTADGSTLLFTSNRTGRTGLWAVAMQGGQAVGEPMLVQDSLANNVRVFTAADGTVYLWQADPARQHVFVAERGAPGSRGLRAYTGGGVSWSPDGRSIAFAKNVGVTNAEGATLIIKDVATGDERPFDHPNRLGPWQVRWSRDGASILVVMRDTSLQILDVASGQFRQIPNPEGA